MCIYLIGYTRRGQCKRFNGKLIFIKIKRVDDDVNDVLR